MARARILKPGFFANELLAEIHPYGRLLFAGLWTLADREGRLEDRPKRIDAAIFPYEECNVEALLSELARRGFVLRYRKNGVPLLQVVNWHKHQRPHFKESASTLPPPEEPGADPLPTSAQHESEAVPDSAWEPARTAPELRPQQPGLTPDDTRTGAVTEPKKALHRPGSVPGTALAGASTDLEQTQHRPGLVPNTVLTGASADLEQAEHRPGLVPNTILGGADTGLETAEHQPGSVPRNTLAGASPDLEQVEHRPGLVPDPALAGPSTDLEPAEHQPGQPCYLLPLPESLLSSSLQSESRAAARPGEGNLCKTLRNSRSPAADSDIHTNANKRNSELTPLSMIAQKVKAKFSPSETAGYIMAHFPMQQLSPSQRPLRGDTGLTVDQVSCLVRHGCTVEMAVKALAHFRQKQVPNKPGAWAFHCLKEELPQDSRIALREETRTAQRVFKEKQGSTPSATGPKPSSKKSPPPGDRNEAHEGEGHEA